MGLRLKKFDLPLLRKELIEQSVRLRTYVIRVGFALTVYFFFLLYSQGELSVISGSQLTLGYGRILFWRLAGFLITGLMLTTPLMAASSITSERERGTLDLLLVTKLSPLTIYFEKLLSCMVPALSFAILMMPMLAVIYALGGVGTTEFLSTLLGVFTLIVVNCSVGVCISAWAKTGFSSLLRCMIGLPLFYFVASILVSLYVAINFSTQSIPILLLANAILIGMNLFIFAGIGAGGIRDALKPVNYVPPSQRNLETQPYASQETSVPRTLKKPKRKLPEEKPVRWKQSVSHSFGNTRFVISLTLLVTIPIALLIIIAVDNWRHIDEGLIALEGIFWVVSGPIVGLMASMMFRNMQSQQTLETLLTTPMKTTDLVKQTQLPVRNWLFASVLVAGILSVIKLVVFCSQHVEFTSALILWTVIDECLRLLIGALMLGGWMWFGTLTCLMFRSSMRSSFIVLAALFLTFLIPILTFNSDMFLLMYLIRLPAEGGVHSMTIPWLIVTGGLTAFFRFVSLSKADHYLGRLGTEGEELGSYRGVAYE